jgi:TatD DNase family protein
MFIDGHCHLTDDRLNDLDSLLRELHQRGITRFVNGGVDPADWRKQIKLQKKHGCLIMCFGLHPYYIKDHSADECEEALDELAKLIPQAQGLGETGLDFRPAIVADKELLQLDCFEKQLELAQAASKPVVLHLVRAFKETQRVFAVWGKPRFGGMVHSFNGSWSQAEYYLSQDLHLSVGGSLCDPKNQRLRQAVKLIPLEKLILETDSPDQAPLGWPEPLNSSLSLFWVAREVAHLKGMTSEEILDSSRKNLEILFSCKTNS